MNLAASYPGSVSNEELRNYIKDDIAIDDSNKGELIGEVSMYKDVLAGELPTDFLTPEKIDNQLFVIFSHIKKELREQLKAAIIERKTGA
jgi:hypothetical protein